MTKKNETIEEAAVSKPPEPKIIIKDVTNVYFDGQVVTLDMPMKKVVDQLDKDVIRGYSAPRVINNKPSEIYIKTKAITAYAELKDEEFHDHSEAIKKLKDQSKK